MTPQELMDLPGYGSAKRNMIKLGIWRATMDDMDRIDWLDGKAVTVTETECSDVLIRDVVGHYWDGGIRSAIDTAASVEFYTEEENQ